MTVEQFISENVNTSRGGYRPDEVIDLIRRAWHAGEVAVTTDLLKTGLSGPSHDAFRQEGGPHRFHGG